MILDELEERVQRAHTVCGADLHETLRCVGSCAHIRVQLQGSPAVGRLDVGGAGIGSHLQQSAMQQRTLALRVR